MRKMKDKFVIALTGVICIASIAVACIATGIDGVVVGSAIGAISGIISGIFGYMKGKGEK